MARTKRTPRKRVGGGIVPLPGTISWALQKPEVMKGDGLRFETPRLLWAVLRELKYVEPPMYTGTRHPLGDRGYTWKVKVTVFKASRDGEDRVVQREHEAIAPWTTYEGGCQDAARKALQVICARYRRRLEHTEYVYLPYRLSATLRIEADMVEPTADPALKVMRNNLKLQTRRLDAAHDEIAYLNRRLDQQRREYMRRGGAVGGSLRRGERDGDLVMLEPAMNYAQGSDTNCWSRPLEAPLQVGHEGGALRAGPTTRWPNSTQNTGAL